ncbi:MAG: CHRD domain-containing protein [Bacteroidetes bacterium]|nr:CHRD domain-containing protein [Bacteroidota bacterium]
MKKNFIVSFSLLMLFIANISFGAHANFTASLNGSQEVPALVNGASGTAILTYTNANGLNFLISVNGLSGTITGAHFHYGSVGVAGPVVKDLTSLVNGNNIQGSWKSTDSQPLNDSLVNALLTGKIYVNVHTTANPGGEIRGAVRLSAGTHLMARLDGLQEVPSVTTNAKGYCAVTLISVGGAGLVYNISLNGLSGAITGAHFHYGGIGVAGPVIKDLTADIVGNNITGTWRTTGTGALVDSLIIALLNGGLYVNVHTAANPGGEIRGQIMPASGFGLTANANGTQEVPSVVTNAKGTGSFTLSDYGLIFNFTAEGLSGAITGAHFHNAATGVAGPVVRDLTANIVNGNTIVGVWKSNDSQPLSAALLKELILGNIYINLHTALNPGGEIRGQVTLKTGTGITANLNGLQEVPSVTTNARGTATLQTVATGLEYNISVAGLSGAITGAHFHYGNVKESGPVVKDITATFTNGTATGIWTTSEGTPFNDSLRAALVAGKIYLNVHTSANPGGEIRGQVLLSSGAGLFCSLEGTQEVPVITTTAKGTGAYTLTRAGLGFNITVNGLSGAITSAHFHYGDQGVAGPVVRDIGTSINGNTIVGYWRTSNDPSPLNDTLISALLNGKIYVNVHTSANPGGEIRGQVLVREGIGFNSNINGTQEVPPVSTTAKGTGSYTLNDGGLIYTMTLNGLSGAATGAHFHNAATGVSGPVVRDILSSFVNNTGTGVWKRTDASALTNTLIAEIVANNVYANVHTVANPGGEIRGQVLTGSVAITGIQQIGTVIADKFSLYQNYPNPFNPSTEIRFDLPKSGFVTLKIFDMTGREVSQLLNQNINAGSFKVNFNAAGLSSGAYYYKLQSDGFVESKKMMLVK